MRYISKILLITFFCLATFSQEQASGMSSVGGGRPNRTYLLKGTPHRQIPLCSTEKEYAEFYAIWKKADKDELQAVHDDGLFFIVLTDTEVKAINYESVTAGTVELNLVKVRLLSGTHRGQEAWTEERFLTDALVAESNQIKEVTGEVHLAENQIRMALTNPKVS